MKKGFSLIEILVVIAIFAILAAVAAESTLLTLRGARKADATSEVRDSLDFAVAIIERQLRNATGIDTAVTTCNSTPTLTLGYLDENERSTVFRCINKNSPTSTAPPYYVASGSASLTSTSIDLTTCNFVCNDPGPGIPKSVDINFIGQKTGVTGADQSVVSVDTRVMLRAY